MGSVTAPRKPRGHFWTHKNYGKQKFQGSYVTTKKFDRYLLLTGQTTGRKVEIESWQMARSLGWKMLA